MEKQDSKITRWHAELHIGKIRTCPTVPDAIYSSAEKDKAISGILPYVATMVEPDEEFYLVVKRHDIKLVPKLKITKGGKDG